MKKNIRGIYIILVILFIFIIMSNIFLNNTKLLYAYTGFISFICIYMLIKYGFMKDNNYTKGSITRIVVATMISFLIIAYSLGLILGFVRPYNQITFNYILNAVLISVIMISSEEIIRYIVARNGQKNKKPIIIFTIIMIILNIIMQINIFNFNSREQVFIFISVVVIPTIAEHLLCTYLTYKSSLVPSLVYRLSFRLFTALAPIIPDLGNYLNSVVGVFMPYTIYSFSRKTIRKAEKAKDYVNKATMKIIYLPILIMLIIVVILVSGIFKYKMIAIGSNSMVPVFYRGDAVVYEKISSDEIDIGDVIVFKENNKVITHRVVSIYKKGNEYLIKTKGDANNTEDKFTVYGSNLLGKVECVVKYVGYPTLWIKEVIE